MRDAIGSYTHSATHGANGADHKADHAKTVALLMGIQTCGKGTQSKLLQQRFGASGITMSDEMLRYPELLADMKAGVFIPDERVIGILKTAVEARMGAMRLIVDGGSRTDGQRRPTDQVLRAAGYTDLHVVHIDIPDEEVTRRLIARSIKENRPDDRDPAAVERRISGFKKGTMVAIQAYERELAPDGRFHRIDGMGGVEEINEQIARVLGWAPVIASDEPQVAYIDPAHVERTLIKKT